MTVLIGYMRVAKADGSQLVDLQKTPYSLLELMKTGCIMMRNLVSDMITDQVN